MGSKGRRREDEEEEADIGFGVGLQRKWPQFDL